MQWTEGLVYLLKGVSGQKDVASVFFFFGGGAECQESPVSSVLHICSGVKSCSFTIFSDVLTNASPSPLLAVDRRRSLPPEMTQW